MRRYELMLLLRPDLEDDKLQSAVERVTRAIVNAGGSLSKVSPWGKRRLAYEIDHHRDASYFLIHFDIEPSAVRGIERSLLITEEILRHMVTLLEEREPDRREPEQPATGAQGPVAAEAAAAGATRVEEARGSDGDEAQAAEKAEPEERASASADSADGQEEEEEDAGEPATADALEEAQR